MYGKYITSWKFLLPLLVVFAGAGFFFARVPVSDAALAWSPLFMILLAFPAFVGLFVWQGWKRAIGILVGLSVFGFAIESLGVATGFPYGEFYYNDALGFRLFTLVPWTLPFGWVPLVIGAAYLTRTISRLWQRIMVGAGILVLADLVLDPGAVYMQFWTWVHGGIYYGVPFTNFLGWVLSGAVGLVLFWFFAENKKEVISHGSRLSIFSLIYSSVFWFGVAVSIHYWLVIFFTFVLLFCCFLLESSSSADTIDKKT